jgi:hypothetical protein
MAPSIGDGSGLQRLHLLGTYVWSMHAGVQNEERSLSAARYFSTRLSRDRDLGLGAHRLAAARQRRSATKLEHVCVDHSPAPTYSIVN